MNETVTATITQIPVSELISFLSAISNRDYTQFLHLQEKFLSQHGTEVWEEYFNFRLLPTLDNASNNWLLEQIIGASAFQTLMAGDC